MKFLKTLLCAVVLTMPSWPGAADSVAAVAPEFRTSGYPANLRVSRNSANTPRTNGDEIVFFALPGECQSRTYGDGRGESDCRNLNTKSIVVRDAGRRGQAWIYAFDLWVDPDLTHRGHYSPDAAPFTGGWNSRLEVAIWQGNFIKNHLYDLEVDTRRGVTFLGHTCHQPSTFGTWRRFEMIVRWANDETGVIQVRCDDRVIYAEQGIATNQPPHCFVGNHCDPGVQRDPSQFTFSLGIHFDKEVLRDGRNVMPRIRPEGLMIRARDVVIRRYRG